MPSVRLSVCLLEGRAVPSTIGPDPIEYEESPTVTVYEDTSSTGDTSVPVEDDPIEEPSDPIEVY